MAELLSDQDIESRLEDSAWRREGDEIVREWQFEDFAEAMSFVNRVAEAAEAYACPVVGGDVTTGPGLVVTANLYVPAQAPGPMPGYSW